ncbi:hypothetical protein O181_016904 [Austropuccinia psidii MF-1]|uniref:Reverse transcriptase domain-containing protein n=1 Tax=Austropuccinia psidii MF-1 TaxID=1389203 RepID=A0A9Q3GS95_9BASI|nr:hypothetical protein [Austropuccinia psidii MF-1]
MNKLPTVFNGFTIFCKIDLCCAYNLLRIKERDENLTAFRIKYGGYEYLVMPFGLTNAPASFQNLVNDIFGDFLDIVILVYLDDMMVFSSSEEEHVKHVASFLQRLRENNFFAKASNQVNNSGKHPIEFDSHNLLPAELNYEINHKDLLGIIWALKHWRAFLLSLSDSFEVLTDHSSLQYVMSSKVLNFCQAHWAEFLAEFNLTITYCQGRLATLPDALSPWDNIYPERRVDFISKNPKRFPSISQAR